jgi:Phosphotransferase enzyme family/Sulfotransferase family
MTGPRRALWDFCQDVLGDTEILARHVTQRPGSEVLQIRDSHGAEFIVKRHLNRRKYRREVHAYTEWVHALGDRAPRLIAAEPAVPAIIMTLIAGQPAARSATRDPLKPGMEADNHRQAGELLRRLHSAPTGRSVPEPAMTLSQRLAHWLPDARLFLAPEDLDLVSRCTVDLAAADSLPMVPCHLDYQPANWMIDPSGFLRVIDFEHARLDITIRDLVRLEYRHWTGRPELREAFFDGYGRPLSYQEQALLRACAAIDAVTAVVRGITSKNLALTSHGNRTLRRLSEEIESAPHGSGNSLEVSHRKLATRSRSMAHQLEDPDIIGRDLALFRTRAYRFSNDPRLYVMAEWTEECFLAGRPPSPAVLDFIRGSLNELRTKGRLLAFDPAATAAQEFDPQLEIDRRAGHAFTRSVSQRAPELFVSIVGAPRSGTSHLVNVLAREQLFAYFTTASCWAWPVWNLHQAGRHLFTETDTDVLSFDNKRTRIIPSLVMPAEAEDVYARSIPVYRHIAGHRYHLDPAKVGDLDILRGGINAHLKHFGRKRFLTKSPFNSFRIPILEEIWGTKVRYIHIIRDRESAARSIRRNRFEYVVGGRLLSAEDAWSHFVSSVEHDAPPERTLTVTHRQLQTEPEALIRHVLDWLDVDRSAAS